MQKQWKRISGWGNYPKLKALVISPSTMGELQQAVKENSTLLARGSGSSYGDSSLQPIIIDTRLLHGIISEGEGWIEVQAGITIKELLRYIVPRKMFLPVTPGTQSVTIGGAIASDVHGKNHLQEGSFFNATISLQLVNETGELITCSREENSTLFYSCFGSMGLTGIIVSAIIKLMPLPSVWIKEQQYFATNINELLSLMQANRTAPYLVAWIDMLGKNTNGIVKTGSWLTAEELPDRLPPFINHSGKTVTIRFTFPMAPPAFAFSWYNKKYLSKAKKQPTRILHYTHFFYPLDSIKNWKYVFGSKGLLQYHFVLPLQVAEKGMNEIIMMVKESKAVCTLAVLKLFREANAETPHAFATEGYNLALDFINSRQAIALIKELDKKVQAYGGQVYKAKDAVSTLPLPVQVNKFQSVQNGRYERK